jgi:hypothetical protein
MFGVVTLRGEPIKTVDNNVSEKQTVSIFWTTLKIETVCTFRITLKMETACCPETVGYLPTIPHGVTTQKIVMSTRDSQTSDN